MSASTRELSDARGARSAMLYEQKRTSRPPRNAPRCLGRTEQQSARVAAEGAADHRRRGAVAERGARRA
eukprot:858044-Pyramimonas_sp.AAC.1